MGIQQVAAIALVLCAAYASALPQQFMDNYVDVDSKSDGKVMKEMAYRLAQVQEDYRAMKNELSRTTNLVEELKKELLSLREVVMERDGQQETMLMYYEAPVETEPQSSLKDVVEEYGKTTDWNTLRQGLENLLDSNSVEYQQLAGVNDYSWGHLWQVGTNGYDELATLLMDAGLSPNKTDNKGDAMLHGAAEGGRLQTARILLEREADVDQRGWRGLTPFNKAALGGKPEMVKWLAVRGATIDSADDEGMTSLHFAAEHGHLDVVKLLVDLGLGTSAKDGKGWTPFDWAQRNNHPSVAEYLSGYPH